MDTNFGTITIELDADKAPLTVANFKNMLLMTFTTTQSFIALFRTS